MPESDPSEARAWYLKQIGVVTPLPETSDHRSVTKSSSVSPGTDLDDLAREAASCTACALAEGRTQVVFGVGNPHAGLVFIGEAPGRDEDIRGEPFVGRAGKLLDKMLAALELTRDDVYIMNVVKCRPPGNRDPKPEEVSACRRWFDAQLQAISPKLICLLGRVAAQNVLETDAPLAAMRGRWHAHHGVPVRVTYHPAYLLRSPQQKQRSWNDLRELARKYRALDGSV
ncbi:MAG: uracil-DNA glycosylase [Mariprofundaceae bacterium]|nr:uracil-DNA glycosylase [Mariprofundaceae bacterium]